MYELVLVNSKLKDHIDLLYTFLSLREFNISHKELPNYKEHSDFVKDHPYRKWYLLKKNISFVGSSYITYSNNIGINIPNGNSKDYSKFIILISKKLKPLKPIKSIRSKDFHININPKNKKLLKAAELLKMDLIENTFRIGNVS